MNDQNASLRRVLKYVIPVLSFSVVFNIPKFFEAEIEYVPDVPPESYDYYDGSGIHNSSSKVDDAALVPSLAVSDLRRNPDYAFYYNNWARLVVLGIMPFAMLVFFNTKIYQDIQVSRKVNSCNSLDIDTSTLLHEHAINWVGTIQRLIFRRIDHCLWMFYSVEDEPWFYFLSCPFSSMKWQLSKSPSRRLIRREISFSCMKELAQKNLMRSTAETRNLWTGTYKRNRSTKCQFFSSRTKRVEHRRQVKNWQIVSTQVTAHLRTSIKKSSPHWWV